MKSARDPDAFMETKTSPSRGTLRGLDWLNFLLADVQTGVGPPRSALPRGGLFQEDFEDRRKGSPPRPGLRVRGCLGDAIHLPVRLRRCGVTVALQSRHIVGVELEGG